MWQDMVMDDSNVLVDVGASNYLAFMNQLRQVPGTINDFGLAIVPCTPDHRVQDETVATIDDLSRLGLAPEKLRVVFNRSACADARRRTLRTPLFCRRSRAPSSARPRSRGCGLQNT